MIFNYKLNMLYNKKAHVNTLIKYIYLKTYLSFYYLILQYLLISILFVGIQYTICENLIHVL